MSSFAGQMLGMNPMQIVSQATGGDALGATLTQQLQDQEDERKKKLMKLGQSAVASMLLGPGDSSG